MIYFLVLISLLNCGACENKFLPDCLRRKYVNSCGFNVTKFPVTAITEVSHTGLSVERCANRFERFFWSLGVYCPSSRFCGFGINLDEDYYSLSGAASTEPLDEICYLVVNKFKYDCDSLQKTLLKVGILEGMG